MKIKFKKRKKSLSLSRKIAIWVVLIVMLSISAVGVFSYMTYRSDSIRDCSNRALAIAESVSAHIDPVMFKEIMEETKLVLEDLKPGIDSEQLKIMMTEQTKKIKNDYWYETKKFVDNVKINTEVEYLYILDSEYDEYVTYFIEGNKPDEAQEDLLDLGFVEPSKDHFIEEYETVKDTKESVATKIYVSGDFGKMVTGIAPICDEKGNVIGIIGIDILIGEVLASANTFGIRIIIIVILLCLLFGIFTLWYINKSIRKPINNLIDASLRIAEGDENVDFLADTNDEIGQLLSSFQIMVYSMREQVAIFNALAGGDLSMEITARGQNDTMSFAMQKMVNNLNNMFHEIERGANSVSSCANRILSGSTELAQGSTEQAASVEELSVTVAGVSSKANDNAKNAKRASALANEIKSKAQKGTEQMEKMTQAVKEVNEANKSISKVIKLIDDIAFKTNILAINAAVEAAHAGEYGKGFAVVADEVRNLAAQSSAAAKDTSLLVKNSIEKAELGEQITEETAGSLNGIVMGINESSKIVSYIAESSEEQRVAITQINVGIEQVANVVHKNSETAEESAMSSEEMNKQAEILKGTVSKFNLKQQRGEEL